VLLLVAGSLACFQSIYFNKGFSFSIKIINVWPQFQVKLGLVNYGNFGNTIVCWIGSSSNWELIKLADHQIGSWSNCELIKLWVDQIVSCELIKLRIHGIGSFRIGSWSNWELIKLADHQIGSWLNCELIKLGVDPIVHWSNCELIEESWSNKQLIKWELIKLGVEQVES